MKIRADRRLGDAIDLILSNQTGAVIAAIYFMDGDIKFGLEWFAFTRPVPFGQGRYCGHK
jgi:hypothetical protein